LNKPKVLILTDWFVPGYKAGGPITSIFNMISSLNGDVNFSLFTRNTDWFDNTPFDLMPDQWLDKYRSKVYYSSRNHLKGAFKSLSMKVDVLYINGFYSPLFNSIPLIFVLLFKRSLKVILAPRGMLNQNAIAIKVKQKRLLIDLLGFLGIEKKVIFHATSMKEKEAILYVYPKANIRIASNLTATPSQVEHRVSKSSFSFLSVGRISAVKNTLELVEMFSQLNKLQLKLVGTEDDEDYFEKCSSVIKASPNIESRGGRNAEEIKLDYQKADFFISMTSGENFGHAIIEALSFGCPVIISDQTPWNDLEEFGAGWVIPLDDKSRWNKVLSEAIVLSDSDYMEMSQKARAYLKTRFNFEEIRSNYLELFSAKG